MHFSDLGMIAQLLALVFAVYAAGAAALGATRARRSSQEALVSSARRAVLMVAAFLLTAALALIFSFTTHDYGVVYVYTHSSRAMPWYYTTAAFYGGQEGSLLYWSMMLAIFSSLAVLLYRRIPSTLLPWALATLMVIESFFLLVLNFASSPFLRTRVIPDDGLGLNPILQDPGMLIHPPMLLMGYMSFSLPFAFAMAALISGRLDAAWLRVIRGWSLAAWSIQTAGLLLGAWWAYHVLGWGGYWGWDPVENAALLPWLTATAFLHSTLVQERRGTLKVWNLSLILLTFGLSIFGTFEVRSGIISSVHSFSYSPLGVWFLSFLVVVAVVAIGLFVYRLPRLKPEQEFTSVVSREGSFLVNNFLLAGIAFAVFWGTVFPILSQVVRNQTMTVGAPFYDQVTGPLFLLLIFTMGVGPLLAWRRASWASVARVFRWPALVAAVCAVLSSLTLALLGETNVWASIGFTVCAFTAATIVYEIWRGVRVRHGHGEAWGRAFVALVSRHRQRYGGYLTHLGLVALAIGVIGSQMFQVTQHVTFQQGQTQTVAGYRITYHGVKESQEGGADVVRARFTVADAFGSRDIEAGRRFFPGFEDQPASIISITQHGLNDLYVFLEEFDDVNNGRTATITVFVNPLTSLVWLGGVLMLLGGIACWWPERRRMAPPGKLVESARERVEALA